MLFYFHFFLNKEQGGHDRIALVFALVMQTFPGGSDSKATAYNAGALGSIPRLGRSPGEEEMATHSNILA